MKDAKKISCVDKKAPIAYFLSFDRNSTDNEAFNNLSVVACDAAVTCLPSCCLAAIS
jgi:hypothetical protein